VEEATAASRALEEQAQALTESVAVCKIAGTDVVRGRPGALQAA